MKLLLVDDNAMMQKIQSTILQKLGHQTSVVSSGQQALAVLSSQAFDCIVMDMQMPEMDGLETTRRIRKSGNFTPIIALTGNDDDASKQACLQAGMNGFLTKPMQTAQVNLMLAKVLS
ncbi:MAG: response regulator [Piscirickettsiaceae bacterium CG_4_10_14_3_um_filter_44_349]|nr:response regulator [Thiomicrospira sp.]PIQ02929.1 MAG: response regulator [Piscirickettsiaceae bacterium CG18_big_fil_WC_8_21_14_2_50_44_103]PIW57481.1 MAG: response regulator [Piscirickettsiaceae bacterium CG12_big_fil_rev_8_21_14_0_65_44_934]PIX80589.1 MAG: response regulator [Piscirickettsiaceae bacterium CG_4_10_14_3_um_filter_44_349]PJC36450.1 MAG: response regulator [Piscirickettsiaceae bacterium CG_4_9_14_0_2_um_filter_44_546]